jgi:hypothetical protein
MEIKHENWPYVVQKYDDNPSGSSTEIITFQWQTGLTINRVFPNNNKYGLSFVDEPDDPKHIWDCPQEWNDDIGKYDPYDGKQYAEGERVDVQLQIRKYVRNDGGEGTGRNIRNIRTSKEQPVASVPDDAPDGYIEKETVKPVLETTQERIGKAQALNIYKDALLAGYSEALGFEEKALSMVVARETLNMARKISVDFSYLNSPLVTEAVAMGGLVQEIEGVTDVLAPEEPSDETPDKATDNKPVEKGQKGFDFK